MTRSLFFLICLLPASFLSRAQDLPLLRAYMDTLCSDYFAGRGYVDSGSVNTAAWLSGEFKAIGLQPFGNGYQQQYTFPVNTFPGKMMLQLDGTLLQPGTGYLVHPAGTGCQGRNIKIVPVDLRKIKDENAWLKKTADMQGKPGNAYLLLHPGSLESNTGKNIRALKSSLGSGIYLLAEAGTKPLWSVSRDTQPATLISIYDSLVSTLPKRLSLDIEQRFIAAYPAANIIGYVPGREQPDSFIVITAHYDHLGKMGRETLFPGASDNASGTAMVLALARFYAAHPGRYSIAFMLFSGEEAGLMGSSYYVSHPLFPLRQIRFLVNLDILGDATHGITVVNATEYPDMFEQLQQLNLMDAESATGRRYVPEVHSRGKAANSDHYPFSIADVPAFFIYSEGGKGYYHDTNDKAAAVSFENIPALSTLLKQFIAGLQREN